MHIVGPRGRPIRYVSIRLDADDRESMRGLVARVQRFVDGGELELSLGFAADPPPGWLARLDQRLSEWLRRRRQDPDNIIARRG